MSSKLRIISGTLGSRWIKTSKNANLKPTPEKLREKLFSWLKPDIENSECLDLFAGSGSLGIEAISNGAKSCTFIEQNPSLYKNLKDNISSLNVVDKSKLHRTRAEDFVRRFKEKGFNIIFFDPPYARDYYGDFLCKVIDRVSLSGTIIYVEQSSYDKVLKNQNLKMLKTSKTGDALGSIFTVNKWILGLDREVLV